jgi:hypothetical protein
MKTVIFASGIVALCLATFAHAQDVFQGVIVASGVRYRLSAVNSSLILVPEVSFASRKPKRALRQDEKLARCDEFVALALEARGLADSGEASLVRDRVEPLPENRTWVLYDQRHQGYRILGAGGRLELDSYGRIVFAGLTYETEKLRTFLPMDSAALVKRAASAVPHPRLGAPISQELMIDPLGDAPAQLRAYVVYQVRANDLVEGWQVTLDAESGEVLDSFSLFMNAESPRAGRPR